MSATSTMTEQSQAATPEASVESFLEQLWGIHPGRRSPRVTPLEPATVWQPLGEGVASWLYRMWGIGSDRHERRAA
jgi:hypothetical protein